ncbi:uncharacterized protein LOC129962112 isoform X1 [Argiope bruennichi]|uniref:uncharacterized protein LOC129962112 isoform X1 n=1 Tax=Argiope bruennichi TaxID=94029 RepID=UPI00249492AE|nr:uncharacterized protein LOC129962112 isoform X1 [Argiope bruennichi]
MFCQVKMQRILKSFLLCIWIFPPQYSDAVDEEPDWMDDDDVNNAFIHSTAKKDDNSEESSDSRHGSRNSPFVQFYIDIGIIIIIIIALYLLWKLLAKVYPQMKFWNTRTETSPSMTQLIEIPHTRRIGENECWNSFNPPDDSEVIIGFDNPLYERYGQLSREDSIVTEEKPPEYETVVFGDKNNSTVTSASRGNPESPPPKYFKYSPLFE